MTVMERAVVLRMLLASSVMVGSVMLLAAAAVSKLGTFGRPYISCLSHVRSDSPEVGAPIASEDDVPIMALRSSSWTCISPLPRLTSRVGMVHSPHSA